MGQVILIVVAAAWAAVLLPPLLRNRAENRPNSSVSDFRDQLSSLQRAMPTRGVAVRSMGRSLAPSSLSRVVEQRMRSPRVLYVTVVCKAVLVILALTLSAGAVDPERAVLYRQF